ncbi:hypothetical protein FPZ24_15310 [Sphingomonas panacisoli]|uniref:Uncharacterized protein n=1 Tax=Sphingomonas panacisoli TaxID=1813879 RepID=A0A5B8LLT4_9SPHN|nr:hypothetical protein [Sphingomonas panacisoli]QDZ08665.1 hypothetical protein FPZ24_15310 [Sphingomonas panacisoli]
MKFAAKDRGIAPYVRVFNRLAAASLAGATGASNNGRSLIPAITAVPVDKMLPIGILYADTIGLTDTDIAAALTYDREARTRQNLRDGLRQN